MAFHSYAHLIRKLFNAYRCGPPAGATLPSSWTCVDHPVSRLPATTMAPSSDSLSLRLRTLRHLASPWRTTRRLIMQKARCRGTEPLQPLANVWFQGLFHSSSEVLFTFPSRYSSTIGLSVVFSLAGWSPLLQPEFLVLRPTQERLLCNSASRTGLSPSADRHSFLFRSPHRIL